MRKYLVAGMAATTVLAFGATAVAQDGPVTMSSSVKPAKAGTKKKPKNTSLTTTITSSQSDKVTTQIDIQLPKTLNVSGKGFKTCSASKMITTAGKGCPKGSKVGKGVAEAVAGIGKPQQLNVTFDVTAFVAGKTKINFLLVARGLGNVYNAPGTLKKTTKGAKLVVKVPTQAQEPAPDLWATLTKLTTTLGAKSGSHLLIGSTGCKKHKQPLSVTLHFGTPPGPGGTSTIPAGTGSASGPAKCS